MKILWKPFCPWWCIFNDIVPMCALDFRTTYGKNNTRKFDTEVFVPVASLNGVVSSLSLFIRYFIGKTGKIWSVLYITAKWICASETLACTIRDCSIVRNILRVTRTCPFISWCSGADNVNWTPWVWHSIFNSIEVNCDPTTAEILSNSHHPNSYIFPNLD